MTRGNGEKEAVLSHQYFDTVVVGAGLAGLSLARQLLLYSTKSVLLIDKRARIPPRRQKVGESTVQLGGYYFSKVLDLEEHLFNQHYLKYNLRFFWKRQGRGGETFEDYDSSYITKFSNIAGYQLDRNRLEAELLRLNLESSRFQFRAPAQGLQISLQKSAPHSIQFEHAGEKQKVTAEWVIDSSGRSKFLARQLGLQKRNAIRHGASFAWVEGLVNVEKLTELSLTQVLRREDRGLTGHLPFWLATNHFMGEGFWLWVIPLQGKTSLGLVFDKSVIEAKQVSNPQKLVQWICRRFPLFARDLPGRKILDRGLFSDFSYDCTQTISSSRWALSGESGRFSDPLYSPGGDLIALHNTMIVDAVSSRLKGKELEDKLRLYEQAMISLYEAYVPSYAVSYNVLGDQEAFTLKYTWELTVYFAFYVFPYINGLFTERDFLIYFLNRFSRLGPINRCMQAFLSGFFEWKKANHSQGSRPVFHDFFELGPLAEAEKTFYKVGLSAEEARQVLNSQLDNLRRLARLIAAWIYGRVLDRPDAVFNRPFVKSLQIQELRFDPEMMAVHYQEFADSKDVHDWGFCCQALERFRQGCMHSEKRSRQKAQQMPAAHLPASPAREAEIPQALHAEP